MCSSASAGETYLSLEQTEVLKEINTFCSRLAAGDISPDQFGLNTIGFLKENGISTEKLGAPLQEELKFHLDKVSKLGLSAGCLACQIGVISGVIVVGGVVTLIAAIVTGGAAAVAVAGGVAAAVGLTVAAVSGIIGALAGTATAVGATVMSFFSEQVCASACKSTDHDVDIDQWIGLEQIGIGSGATFQAAQSSTSISSAIIDKNIYISSLAPDGTVQLMHCVLGADGSGWQTIPTTLSYSDIQYFCLAACGESLAIIYQLSDGLYSYMSSNPADPEAWVETSISVDDEEVLFSSRPAANYFNGKLYIAGKSAENNSVILISYDGNTWSGNTPITDRKGTIIQTDSDVSLCTYNNRLYCVYPGSGSNSHLRFLSANAGVSSWSEEEHVKCHGKTVTSKSGVASAAFNNKMYIFYPDSDQDIRWLTWDGNHWRGKTEVKIVAYNTSDNKKSTQKLKTDLGFTSGTVAFDESDPLSSRFFIAYVSNTAAHADEIIWSVE